VLNLQACCVKFFKVNDCWVSLDVYGYSTKSAMFLAHAQGSALLKTPSGISMGTRYVLGGATIPLAGIDYGFVTYSVVCSKVSTGGGGVGELQECERKKFIRG